MMSVLHDEDPMMRTSGGKGTATVGDALRLPFPDACFDRVIAAEVLEHIPDDRQAMAELARVLRPGGTMAVTVPRWWPELVNWALSDDYHNNPGGHIRIYRRTGCSASCATAGSSPTAATTPTPCTARTGGCAARSVSPTTTIRWSRPITGCWCGTSPRSHPLTRVPEALLNPVLGKSVVVYLRKPA